MTGLEKSFETEHLEVDLELPAPDCETDAVADSTFPDVYVGLEIDLLAPGDGIVTDRHHASADRYEADDPQNQIAGQISPFTLSGWLRHGCERVLQTAGMSACHPGEPDADYMLADVYDRDLAAGYHEKGACCDAGDDEAGCVVYELFGGFGERAGRVVRRPIRFSPIRRQVDVLQGEAEAHYRQLHTQVRSRNDADAGQPLRQATRDVVGNLEGTWKLTLRELRPEYVGLLVEAIATLDAHSAEYDFQLGGARNFGAGIVDATVVTPLYTPSEVRRVYDRAKAKTAAMEEKDAVWNEQWRPQFVAALAERVDAADASLAVAADTSIDGGETDG